jgi:cytochrome c
VKLSFFCGMFSTAALFCSACKPNSSSAPLFSMGGDPARGRAAIERYGCAGCHTIPGARNTTALVGPTLEKIASRSYVGGVTANTPENMIRWILNPQSLNPRSAMPNLRVTESDARDIASYLYTLK